MLEEDASAWWAGIVQERQGALRRAFRTWSDSTAEPRRYVGEHFRQGGALIFPTSLSTK